MVKRSDHCDQFSDSTASQINEGVSSLLPNHCQHQPLAVYISDDKITFFEKKMPKCTDKCHVYLRDFASFFWLPIKYRDILKQRPTNIYSLFAFESTPKDTNTP